MHHLLLYLYLVVDPPDQPREESVVQCFAESISSKLCFLDSQRLEDEVRPGLHTPHGEAFFQEGGGAPQHVTCIAHICTGGKYVSQVTPLAIRGVELTTAWSPLSV